MTSYSSLIRHAGNQGLFRAVEMSIVSTLRGRPLHLHVEGLRGTGKTTILRSAKSILPKIVRIKGCLYNCDPERPHCPEHSSLLREQVEMIGVEEIPVPFLEISHSAKIGTVVGTIDLARLTSREDPRAAILPGTIPQAHRGIVFVDEINRLADTSPELTDVLLDLMGTTPGRVQIEEGGMPKVELTVRVSVWAASNPDEDPGPLADIRRQLSDRFTMNVSMGRPRERDDVLRLLCAEAQRTEPGDGDREHCERLRRLVSVRDPEVVGDVRETIARIYTDYNLESLRAVEALQDCSKVSAILSGRPRATCRDLIDSAADVLRHRVDLKTLSDILKAMKQGSGEDEDKAGIAGSRAESRPETEKKSEENENQWTKLLERLRQRRSPTTVDGRADGEGRGGGKSGSQGGSVGVADPDEIDLQSPARIARPIGECEKYLYTDKDLARKEEAR